MKFVLPIFLFLLQSPLLWAQADWPPLAELVTRAEEGDPEARVALAFRNYDSQGITREPVQVYKAFEEGVRLGIPDAYAGLALCYLYGWGTTWDSYKAYRLARLAVDLGSPKGHLALGVLAMEGQPARHLKDRAQEFLTKAAERGDLQARYLLATHKFEENGFSQQVVDPASLEKLAEQGHEGAIFSLFAYYRNRDEKKAENYLKQGLELEIPGVLMAQAFPDPSDQDFDSENTREENRYALDSYRRAAARGDRVAMFRYAYGLFRHPDLAEDGEDWREIMAESARLGQISACDILARSYYKPTAPGVDPDYAKAAELLLGTLKYPNAGRYQTLGLIYADGDHGAPKNPERAFKLLARYANQTPYVYRMLGRILTDWEPLQGKEAYKIRAYACYLRYQELAPEPREGLFEERTAPLALTAEQIAEARKLADEGYPTEPGDTLWADGDGPYAPENLARDAVEAYRAGGEEALRALLDERLDEFHLANPRASHLFQSNLKRFLRLYREAQTGSGRHDPGLAAALYGWMYDKARNYPVSFGRIVVLYNYYLSLSETGQRGRARDLLNEVGEIYALTGLITDPAAHPEKRSFPTFPEVNVPDYREVEAMDLNQVALVHLLAKQSFVEGRWKDALSQAQAGLDLVTHKLDAPGEIKKRRNEWANHLVSNRETMAEIHDLLQFHQKADELRLINIESKLADTYGGRNRLTGKLANTRNEILRGQATPETVERLRGLLDKISDHPYLVRRHRQEAEHALILALFSTGETAEAWESLEARRKESPTHLPFHLLWVERKIESNELDGLEEILISQLESVRRQGEKLSEYRLYLLYAQFLKASGRLDEAIRIQSEAIRLLQSFDLYTHLPSASLDLADLYALAGSLDEAERERAKARQWLNDGRALPDPIRQAAEERLQQPLSAGETADSRPIQADLQPRKQACFPLEGFPARGIFILKNPSHASLTGQLQVTGVHLALTPSSDTKLYEVKVDPSEKLPKTSPVNLTLHAGEMVVFDLMTNRSDFESSGTLQLDWIPDKGPPLRSEWSFEPSISDGEQRAVVDAGLYSRNPFFSVPIYHVIQSQTPLTRPVDLRVIASQAARVEVYDEQNELVFIDHNGNGDLSETGDVLAVDANADGHGDLSSVRQNARSTVFYLQVTPFGELPEEGLTLQLQNRGESGRWEDVSKDLILPAEE